MKQNIQNKKSKQQIKQDLKKLYQDEFIINLQNDKNINQNLKNYLTKGDINIIRENQKLDLFSKKVKDYISKNQGAINKIYEIMSDEMQSLEKALVKIDKQSNFISKLIKILNDNKDTLNNIQDLTLALKLINSELVFFKNLYIIKTSFNMIKNNHLKLKNKKHKINTQPIEDSLIQTSVFFYTYAKLFKSELNKTIESLNKLFDLIVYNIDKYNQNLAKELKRELNNIK